MAFKPKCRDATIYKAMFRVYIVRIPVAIFGRRLGAAKLNPSFWLADLDVFSGRWAAGLASHPKLGPLAAKALDRFGNYIAQRAIAGSLESEPLAVSSGPACRDEGVHVSLWTPEGFSLGKLEVRVPSSFGCLGRAFLGHRLEKLPPSAYSMPYTARCEDMIGC